MTGLNISDLIGSKAHQSPNQVKTKFSKDGDQHWASETLLSYLHCVIPRTPFSAPCRSPALAQKGRAPLEFTSIALLLLLVWTQIPHQQAAQCSAQTLPPMMQCCLHQQPLQQTLRIWVQMNLSCWPNWRSRTGNSGSWSLLTMLLCCLTR